jgi:curved DNA-binding protein CbpA
MMNEHDWQRKLDDRARMETRARAILGVPPGAGAGEIRSAYRRAAKEYHPDKRPQDRAASERFKAVNAAFRFLTDGTRNQLLLAKAGTEPASRKGARYNLDNPWGYFCWWREQFF